MWNGKEIRPLSHLDQLFIWREISKNKVDSKIVKSHLWKDLMTF